MRIVFISVLIICSNLLFAQQDVNTNYEDEEMEVLFGGKPKIPEKEIIPGNILKMADKGSKVFLFSADNNAAIHSKDFIEEWGYWQVTPDAKDADFILKFHTRVKGFFNFRVKADFIDPATSKVLYTTQEVRSVKDKNEPNRKRSAVKQLFEYVFKDNFK